MDMGVLSLNLWGRGGPYTERARLVAKCIDRLQPDLLGFQECLRVDDQDDVSSYLASQGYHVLFGWTMNRSAEESFGNLIATRWPIIQSEARPLPVPPKIEPRIGLAATVDSPAGPLRFISTHLSWEPKLGAARQQQVAALFDLAQEGYSPSAPAPILVGDFNALPNSAAISDLRGRVGADGFRFRDAWQVAGNKSGENTWSQRNDYARSQGNWEGRIDYIFVGADQYEVESCAVVCDEAENGVWASDHFGLFARLKTLDVK